MNKLTLKRLLAFLLCIVLLFGALSCAQNEPKPEVEQKDDVTFTDALGRKVHIKKNPERVAALLGSFADIWMLAGGSLCAAAEDAWEDFGLALDAVNLGGAHSPSLEKLIAAAPDLVLASASTASNVEMEDALEAMGIAVVYFDVDNFDDYLHMLDLCTELTGRKDLYQQNGLVLKEEIDAIKTAYQNADLSEKEQRILLLRASSSTVKAKGSRGTILGEMLADIGCINIADRDTMLLENLSVEEVIREEPYRIFVVTMGSNTEAAHESLKNMIKENPAWSTLDALESGRLYIMDKTLFNLKPNRRWAEAYAILYEKLTEN